MKAYINKIREFAYITYGYTYSRTTAQWLNEWKAHNVLYRWKYKVSQVKDVDLNENETHKRQFLYWCISLLYPICK